MHSMAPVPGVSTSALFPPAPGLELAVGPEDLVPRSPEHHHAGTPVAAGPVRHHPSAGRGGIAETLGRAPEAREAAQPRLEHPRHESRALGPTRFPLGCVEPPE